MRALVVLFALSAACGYGLSDEPGGGGSNLPTLGAGPYGKPEIDFDTPADEPFVVVDRGAGLHDPTVLRRGDGGFRIWFGRQLDNVEDESEIWYAEIPGVLDLPDVGPESVLVADQGWEEGRVAAPSVVDPGDGTLVMFYEGGVASPGIGRATSTDGGVTWEKDPANPLLLGAAEPGAGIAGETWLLYVTRPGMEPGIFRAVSPDGVAFDLDPDPLIRARPDLPEAFDRAAVSDPYLLVERTPAGRLHYGLFFNGHDGDEDVSIGYAGSFDGVAWERFGGAEPVLTRGSPTEHGPAAVLEPARGFLFYNQLGAGRQRIGVALHP